MKRVLMICFTLVIAFTMIGPTNNECSYDFHFFVEEGEGQ